MQSKIYKPSLILALLLKVSSALWLLSRPQPCNAEVNFQLANSVVKVVAKSNDNKTQLGSGVVISENKVATNCHVMRKASSAFLLKAGRRYKVLEQSSLPEFDVCILKTEPLQLPIGNLDTSNLLTTGEPIIMFGYPLALGLRFLQGSIKALHPQGQHSVIEINTGFLQGASGGGVFNQHGKLIGLATFMTRNKQNLHFFVIPSTWIKTALSQPFKPIHPFKSKSFWENGSFHFRQNQKIERNLISGQ